jgi:hypothetical protein
MTQVTQTLTTNTLTPGTITEVRLSNGKTVHVGDINWSGYCALREKFLDLLTGDLLKELTRLLATPLATCFAEGIAGRKPTFDLQAVIGESAETIRDSLPRVGQSIRAFLLGVDREFIAACVQEVDFEPAACSARDVLSLRETAYRINDPAELLAMEKNFLAAIAQSAVALTGLSQSWFPTGVADGNTI